MVQWIRGAMEVDQMRVHSHVTYSVSRNMQRRLVNTVSEMDKGPRSHVACMVGLM